MYSRLFSCGALAGVWLLVVLWTVSPGYGAQKGTSRPDSLSTEELQDVVNLLENPEKREALVKDLKAIAEARDLARQSGKRKTLEKKEVMVVERIFLGFDALSREFVEAASSAGALAADIPQAFDRVKRLVADPKQRRQAMWLLLDVFLAVMISLMLRFILRRYPGGVQEGEGRFRKKLGAGLLRALFNFLPYGALFVSLFLLCQIFPSHPRAHVLVIVLSLIFLIYRAVLETFRVLVAPDDSPLRLIPISDEDAHYCWIWMRRFANYTVFYFLLTNLLYLFNTPEDPLTFIRGMILVVFPILISVFVLQLGREMRLRQDQRDAEDQRAERKTNWMARPVLRHWPVLVIVYAWAIFILLIVHFESGYAYLFMSTLGTLIVLFATLTALHLKNRLFIRMFAVNELVKERFPGLEEKTNRYIQIIGKTLDLMIILAGAGAMAEVLGVPVSDFVVSETGSLIILRIIAIMVTIGVVFGIIEVSYLIAEAVLSGRLQKDKRMVSQKTKTMVPVILTAVKIGVWFTGGIIILDRIGVNTTPILAGAGIVGLAVGFGSQTLVKDVINGLFILFEESIRIGDWATLGNKGGHVEAIGLRTVRLRDLHGNVHVIPNSSIETVTNLSKEYSRAVMDVGVAYREDVDKVIEVLEEVGRTMQEDPEYGKSILEPLEIFGLDRFEDSSVVIRARFMTKPLKQWSIRREFNRRLKKAFDERDIEIPFPHRTVYMGLPKEGPAPPLEVNLKGRTE